MKRTTWLQDRRMQKFRDVLSRWERKELSAMEAGELLGCSERQFRRYRRRYEEDGLAGLADRRLGKASMRRVPVDKLVWMLGEYRTHHLGWNVKHFHEHIRQQHGFRWGYTWTKTQLHTAGLVERAARRGAHRRKRPRKPCEGMMLHQDGSRFAWLSGAPELDLIVTMDDATSTIYSAFLVEEEGTVSTFCGLLEVFTAKGLAASLYTDRGSHYFYTPKAGEAVERSKLTQWDRAYCGLFAGGARAFGTDVWDAAGSAAEGTQAGRDLRHRRRQSVHPRGLSSGAQRAFCQAAADCGERFRRRRCRDARRDPVRGGRARGGTRQHRFS